MRAPVHRSRGIETLSNPRTHSPGRLRRSPAECGRISARAAPNCSTSLKKPARTSDPFSNGYLACQMLATGRNYAKTALLLGLLTGLLVGVGWLIGGSHWAAYALIFAAVLNFASYWWSDKIVLALHGAEPVRPGDLPELDRIVTRLAQRAGIPKPRLYRVHDPAPNAFATGRNPEHAVV